MIIYNPTEDVVEGFCDGRPYLFSPDGEIEVEKHIGEFLLRKYNREGLTPLDFNSSLKSQYSSFDEFKLTMKLDGVKRYKGFIEECLYMEKAFPKEVNMKNGGEMEMSNTKVPFFENRLKQIQKHIQEIEKDLISKKKVKKEEQDVHKATA